MAIQVLVCEVHVQILHHVQSTEVFVKQTRFMEHFMSHCELHGLQVRKYEDECKSSQQSEEVEVKLCEHLQNFEEKKPIRYNSDVEHQSEVEIPFLQLLSFFLCWITDVKAKELIK